MSLSLSPPRSSSSTRDVYVATRTDYGQGETFDYRLRRIKFHSYHVFFALQRSRRRTVTERFPLILLNMYTDV